MRIGGFILFTRQSDGGLNLATYHPRTSGTWLWSVSFSGGRALRGWRLWSLASNRRGQWHDFIRLPFGKTLIISHQDFHRERSA